MSILPKQLHNFQVYSLSKKNKKKYSPPFLKIKEKMRTGDKSKVAKSPIRLFSSPSLCNVPL